MAAASARPSCASACTRAGARPVLIHTTQWLEAAQRLYARLGFVRRPDRDVPYEVWHDPEKDHDLPPEWTGEEFLAYGWPDAVM